MKQKRFLLFFVVLAAVAGVAIFFLTRPKELSIGFQPAAANYPMMHALDGGFFERAGLKPQAKVFQSANDALDALLGGSVFLDSVIPIQNIASVQIERPGSIGIIALLMSDTENPIEFIVVPKASRIASAKDLSGKTVVVFPGTFAETLTRLALNKLGVKNVRFLKLPPGDMVQAIRTGQADAGVVYEPVASLAEHQGWGRVVERGLWEKTLLSPLVIGAYAYNAPAARQNPTLARRAWEAISSAIQDSRTNPLQARRPLVKYLKIPEVILPKLPSPRVEMADAVAQSDIQRTVEFYAQNGILAKPVNLAPLLVKP